MAYFPPGKLFTQASCLSPPPQAKQLPKLPLCKLITALVFIFFLILDHNQRNESVGKESF